MTDRDTFAAAALTGMMSRVAGKAEAFAEAAYKLADAMLRERDKETSRQENEKPVPKRKWVHGCTGVLWDGEVGMEETDNGPVYKIGDGKTEWDDLPTLVKSTNHGDAATGEPGGGVGLSSGSRTGQINRTPERQSPDRECEESPLRDVSQPDNGRAAGGPERNTQEPVAWAAAFDGEVDAEFVWPFHSDALHWREKRPDVEIVPLYRHPQPTLTEAEREAVEAILKMPRRQHYDCDDTWHGCPLSEGGCSNPSYGDDDCNCGASAQNEQMDAIAATLRGLLERMG